MHPARALSSSCTVLIRLDCRKCLVLAVLVPHTTVSPFLRALAKLPAASGAWMGAWLLLQGLMDQAACKDQCVLPRTQNQGMLWVQRDLRVYLVPPPAMQSSICGICHPRLFHLWLLMGEKRVGAVGAIRGFTHALLNSWSCVGKQCLNQRVLLGK